MKHPSESTGLGFSPKMDKEEPEPSSLLSSPEIPKGASSSRDVTPLIVAAAIPKTKWVPSMPAVHSMSKDDSSSGEDSTRGEKRPRERKDSNLTHTSPEDKLACNQGPSGSLAQPTNFTSDIPIVPPEDNPSEEFGRACAALVSGIGYDSFEQEADIIGKPEGPSGSLPQPSNESPITPTPPGDNEVQYGPATAPLDWKPSVWSQALTRKIQDVFKGRHKSSSLSPTPNTSMSDKSRSGRGTLIGKPTTDSLTGPSPKPPGLSSPSWHPSQLSPLMLPPLPSPPKGDGSRSQSQGGEGGGNIEVVKALRATLHEREDTIKTVSYTHLTLPTICSV